VEIASSRCPRVRAVESAPAGNYASRVHIGIGFMVTLPTLETFLRATIQLFNMATQRTFATGISSIDGNYLDARQRGLVLNVCPQLTEAPAHHFSASDLLNPDPRTNAFEVFKDYRSIRAFGLLDDFLADLVVKIGGIALFFASPISESSFCGFGLLALKLASQATVALSEIAHVSARERLTVAIGGNSGDAQINAEESIRIVIGRWFDHIHRGEQKPFAISDNEVGLALSRFKKLLLLFASHEADFLSPRCGPDRNVILAISKDAVVKSDRSIQTEDTHRLFIELVGIRHFGDHAHGKLGGKAELLTDFFIGELMQVKLTKYLCIPGNPGALVSRRIRKTQRLFKRLSLSSIGSEFKTDSQFHAYNYTRRLFLKTSINREIIALGRAISNSSPPKPPKMAVMGWSIL
jgi:hypothetical protein